MSPADDRPIAGMYSEAPTHAEDRGDKHAGVANRDMSDAIFLIVMYMLTPFRAYLVQENLLSALRFQRLSEPEQPPSAI
ncbi:hypothetical protein EV702DRAFT_1196973 [Suillus placidus]|uniref:Uncharacterized protein n=1 Tax=Suillus placidus TaxID=48579 RepID=A0A9P6ZX49_9AGAM|nr:hypothetical protein EV702DRAFT_1196973 [Suillus placidus]